MLYNLVEIKVRAGVDTDTPDKTVDELADQIGDDLIREAEGVLDRLRLKYPTAAFEWAED
jgi:hypothetical protein